MMDVGLEKIVGKCDLDVSQSLIFWVPTKLPNIYKAFSIFLSGFLYELLYQGMPKNICSWLLYKHALTPHEHPILLLHKLSRQVPNRLILLEHRFY